MALRIGNLSLAFPQLVFSSVYLVNQPVAHFSRRRCSSSQRAILCCFFSPTCLPRSPWFSPQSTHLLPVPHTNVDSNSTLPLRTPLSHNNWYVRRRYRSSPNSGLAARKNRVPRPVHLAARLRIYHAFRVRPSQQNLHPFSRFDPSFRR